jgi:adenylate kinase
MSEPPLQLIVLGPPGAGKGTQAKRLASRFGLLHINPGQILREQIPADSAVARGVRSAMAAGELVPDELVDEVVRERLEALPPDRGFVLDGYPRTLAEAETLRKTLGASGRLRQRPLLVWLDVPATELVRRLRRRRELEGRADDADDAIATRIEIHDASAGPLLEALGRWVETLRIDGSRPTDTVTGEIVDRLCARLAGMDAAGTAGSPGPQSAA